MPKLTVLQEVTPKILPKLTQKLLTDLRIYGEKHLAIKELETEKERAAELILQNGIETDEEKFEIEGYGVKLVLNGTKKSLDKDKLVKRLALKTKLTVEQIQAIIAACTEETPTKPYASITLPKHLRPAKKERAA